MFNDLFYLSNGEKHPLVRNKIIDKMKKINEIKGLGVEYKTITESKPFKVVKGIRDNFVHNKSSTYYGMDVSRLAGGGYANRNSKGISTQKTYKAICKLVRSYERLCVLVNKFIVERIEDAR
jgi:hypothetical protein